MATPSYTLSDLSAALRAIGRGAVFYATGAYAGTATDLNMTHLGDTEGAIEIKPTYNLSELKAPELYGDAPLEAKAAGPAIDLQFSLWSADPSIRAIVQPVAGATGGTFRPRSVTEYTLAIFPEELFIEADAEVAVAYTTAAGWTVGGDAASAAQLALIDDAIWFWRGYWTEPLMPTYQYDDGGKALAQVTFRAMVNLDMPDGQLIYTLGDPSDSDIEIASA